MFPRVPWLGLALASVLLPAGCGNPNAYDAGAVEATVVETQSERFEELDVGEARCPDEVQLQEGVTLTCTLDVDGVDVPYDVTLTDVEAREITISVAPAATVIRSSDAARHVQANLAEAVSDADVTCGEDDAAVILAEPGDVVTCTVAIGSQTREVDLEVLDEDGAVQIED